MRNHQREVALVVDLAELRSVIAAPLLTCAGGDGCTFGGWWTTSLPGKLLPTATTVNGFPARLAKPWIAVVICTTFVCGPKSGCSCAAASCASGWFGS